ncbi:MAG: hypothetical protein EOM25_04715 [Deltaproteobacteria bacterium]|nr:hypothetical protein [Deltaproteobacteria bacterium]
MYSIVSLLEEAAEDIRRFEAQAVQALDNETEGKSVHDHWLRRKAKLLRDLPERASSLVDALPEKLVDLVMDRLNTFSFNAANSLRIGSPFYMSALLYPDNHRQGQPNDLELLVTDIVRELERRF